MDGSVVLTWEQGGVSLQRLQVDLKINVQLRLHARTHSTPRTHISRRQDLKTRRYEMVGGTVVNGVECLCSFFHRSLSRFDVHHARTHPEILKNSSFKTKRFGGRG